MNKNYFSFKSGIIALFVLSINMINAQNTQSSIPNMDFENWSGGLPVNWDVSNENIMGVQFTTASQDNSGAFSGSSAIKLESQEQYIFIVGNTTLPGLATLGDFYIDLASQDGGVRYAGIPFTSRPTAFKAHYKTAPASGDQAYFLVTFTKWNSSTQTSDTIGKAKLTQPATINSWTALNLPITWTSTDAPDSMNIILSSSDVGAGNYIATSKLWVDNLSFEYVVTGEEELLIDNTIRVYPNPVKDQINIEFEENSENNLIQLVDLSGKILKEVKAEGNKNISIDMSAYSKGTYLLNIFNPSSVINNTIRILK
ncbi:MAG TPA: T9SS type A sorting domain-containing protein [Bacteroidetes bacterium]|nr:T9SS type A sorting domain-containing protein [Bacteroidota bacterium]